MDLIRKHNEKYQFFKVITGEAMRVHAKFKPGLLESVYEAALKYLLEQQGMKCERQVHLPIYWDNVKLDQSYRMDLVANGNVILELKAIADVGIRQEFVRRKVELLEYARKKTTQKVNLFEKVQIPGYQDAIRKIKRFMEDEENLSKSSQKIVKGKREREAMAQEERKEAAV